MRGGKISGADKLLPDVYTEIAKNDHRYTWREASPTVKAEFRALNANPSRDICIAAISSGTTTTPRRPFQITVTGGRTVFTTLAVSPGTKILLVVNHDPFPHRLYVVGDTGFKESDTSAGGSITWTAPGSGKYEFRDHLAPTLRFFVVVDPGVVEVVYPSPTTADVHLPGPADGRLLPQGVLQWAASWQAGPGRGDAWERRAEGAARAARGAGSRK